MSTHTREGYTRKAKDVYLTRIGEAFGLPRRWFGLEPDFLYRRRLLKAIAERNRPRPPQHFNCRCVATPLIETDGNSKQ